MEQEEGGEDCKKAVWKHSLRSGGDTKVALGISSTHLFSLPPTNFSPLSLSLSLFLPLTHTLSRSLSLSLHNRLPISEFFSLGRARAFWFGAMHYHTYIMKMMIKAYPLEAFEVFSQNFVWAENFRH